jgi:hypothetical protein
MRESFLPPDMSGGQFDPSELIDSAARMAYRGIGLGLVEVSRCELSVKPQKMAVLKQRGYTSPP